MKTSFQFIFAFFLAKFEAVKYNDYVYPIWAQVLGFFIVASSLVWVPAYAIYYLYKQKKPLREARFNLTQ